MAGIGVQLNRIFEKNTLTTHLAGFAYSTVVTVAPMFVIILNIMLMGYFLGFDTVGYAQRELFSCTVLYTFIFSLLTASPFNAVLSRYLSDVIYEERYEDILPCYYLGLILNLGLSVLLGIPFCVWEFLVGKVDIFYVFTGFCGYVSLVLVFYSMIYLSICKDYRKISLYFLLGMAAAFFLSLALFYRAHFSVTESMLTALAAGFLLTAILEYSLIRSYFRKNSGRYRPVLHYFCKYWKLIFANFLYILGLYIHNFVFWTTDYRMVVAKSFVCNQSYDMATCLAMFTNISASVIFIARVEMHFHERYKNYSEAVIGGRKADIENAKKRMFLQLSSELMTLVRIQFIISVVIYMAFLVLLPGKGYSGMVLKIYPLLAAGYFILFLMYSVIIFLYYFDDLNGALLTAAVFCLVTFVGSLFSRNFPVIWFGSGLLLGAFAGWCVSYFRLRFVEKHLDAHVFCRGTLVPMGRGGMPSAKTYERRVSQEQSEKKGEEHS